MVRKLRFPIKFKLITIITLLLVISLSLYVFFALDLFKKDKSAYVFETSMTITEGVSAQVENILTTMGNELYFLAKFSSSNRELTKLFKARKTLIDFTIYQNNKLLVQKFDSDILKGYNLPKEYFKDLYYQFPLKEQDIKRDKILVKSIVTEKGIPHILISVYHAPSNSVISGRFLLSKLMAVFNKENIYKSFVVNRSGQLFAHYEMDALLNNNKTANKKYLANILKGSLDKGVREFREAKESYLVAFHRIDQFGLYVISEISQAKAFEAATYLVNKSLFFGIFVIALSLIIGIFFSRSLTHHIGRLFQATQKIAAGNFSEEVKIKSNDEIGVLSDSFNFMSQEIVRYMDEMKEKARMENEIAVAQLVQSSFFPDKDIQLPGLDISAFYTPASECGGDWWGCFEFGDKSIVIIADATGHGVPAALLTATVNCCTNNLKSMAKLQPEILESPAKILTFMNHAVCSIGNKIMLTCFVALVDKKSKVVRYANASHNPPLIYKAAAGQEASKNSFKPLMGENGPRLGHKIDAEFRDDQYEISPEDVMILYTDGLIECANTEEKQWGKRSFLKSLAAHANRPVSEFRDNVIGDAQKFYGDQAPDDDITLVIAKIC